MTCGDRYFLVCRHVSDVYYMPGDYSRGCDGYIVCRLCNEIDWPSSANWRAAVANWRTIPTDLCQRWLQGLTWVRREGIQ